MPAVGANVQVHDSRGRQAAAGRTDASGRCAFPLTPGAYSITASGGGPFTTNTVQVTLGNQSATHRLTLPSNVRIE